jgi:hypothetical protein
MGIYLAVSNKNFDEDFDKAAEPFHQRHRMKTLIHNFETILSNEMLYRVPALIKMMRFPLVIVHIVRNNVPNTARTVTSTSYIASYFKTWKMLKCAGK